MKMSKYEIMYILSSNLNEKQIDYITNNINNIFEKNGKILDFKKPELKTLSYSIKNFSQGFYTNLLVEIDNNTVKEFNRIMNITEEIIRYIILKAE